WNSLADQLKLFREYTLSADLALVPHNFDDEIEILADLLHRASDIGATPLSRAVRALAAELIGAPGGADIVGRLLPRMIRADGRVAVDGVQIAWELRDHPVVREAVVSLLPALLRSNDYALQARGADLAKVWGQQTGVKRVPLPAGYSIHIPESVMSRR